MTSFQGSDAYNHWSLKASTHCIFAFYASFLAQQLFGRHKIDFLSNESTYGAHSRSSINKNTHHFNDGHLLLFLF